MPEIIIIITVTKHHLGMRYLVEHSRNSSSLGGMSR